MTGKARLEDGKNFVMLTRELVGSDAWRSASINARRLLDFLIVQHLSRAGKDNGKLKAPYEQLVTFGISSSVIADVMREVEELGLVEAERHGMRVATTYTLTWLATHDKRPASDRWRDFQNPALKPLPKPKSRNLPSKPSAELPSELRADRVKLPSEVRADAPQNLPSEPRVLSIRALPGRR